MMFFIFHPPIYNCYKRKPMRTLVYKILLSGIGSILFHLNQRPIISLSDLRHGHDDLINPLLSALFALHIDLNGDPLRRRNIRH
jgi:hypothetical protein